MSQDIRFALISFVCGFTFAALVIVPLFTYLHFDVLSGLIFAAIGSAGSSVWHYFRNR